MPFVFQISNDYGYVIAIALGVVPLLAQVQGGVVGNYRKKAKIAYPNMYATAAHAKESKEAYQFNCAQRAHQQLLENLPQILASLLVAGLIYPRLTAVLGVNWVVSRILYAYGYITSDKPNGRGRMIGTTQYISVFGLWGACLLSAWNVVTA